MSCRNTAPSSEEGRVPELSDHVAGLDFHEVILWAKQQDIPAAESLNNMLGIKPITIDLLSTACPLPLAGSSVTQITPRVFSVLRRP